MHRGFVALSLSVLLLGCAPDPPKGIHPALKDILPSVSRICGLPAPENLWIRVVEDGAVIEPENEAGAKRFQSWHLNASPEAVLARWKRGKAKARSYDARHLDSVIYVSTRFLDDHGIDPDVLSGGKIPKVLRYILAHESAHAVLHKAFPEVHGAYKLVRSPDQKRALRILIEGLAEQVALAFLREQEFSVDIEAYVKETRLLKFLETRVYEDVTEMFRRVPHSTAELYGVLAPGWKEEEARIDRTWKWFAGRHPEHVVELGFCGWDMLADLAHELDGDQEILKKGPRVTYASGVRVSMREDFPSGPVDEETGKPLPNVTILICKLASPELAAECLRVSQQHFETSFDSPLINGIVTEEYRLQRGQSSALLRGFDTSVKVIAIQSGNVFMRAQILGDGGPAFYQHDFVELIRKASE